LIFGAQRPPFDPHRVARTILAEPRFRMHVLASPRKTWWDLFWGWLNDRWHQLTDAFAHHVHIGTKTSIAAGDIILIAASAVVIVVLARLAASYVREAPRAAGVPLLRSSEAAEALYARGVQAANGGDYVAAVTLLFRAALVALDLRGVLHDEPSLTVNECRQEVRERAARAVVPFDALARIFTTAIYAEAPVTKAQWQDALRAYAQLTGHPDAA
jgi:hypothetical protein